VNWRIAKALVAIAFLPALIPPAIRASENNRSAYERRLGELGDTAHSQRNGRTAKNQAASIAKLIEDIDAAIRKDKRRMLSIITINTDVAASTLEQQKSQTGFSYGEVYVAHALALATHKKFDAIAKLKKSGRDWSQIAHDHKVTLHGSRELIRQMKESG
jgi:hypothetical protein